MTKKQRYRYEMLVRVRDFGVAHAGSFPPGSAGGRAFAEVTTAVATIEDFLTKRDLARVAAGGVKAATRAAVSSYMKDIARTARRITLAEHSANPFRRGGQATTAALLAKARMFIDEARPREATFVELGMSPTFIADFTALVDALASAVTVHNNGRAWRERAQVGIEHALTAGTEAVHNLDVIVINVLRSDPVGLGHWHGARHIEGVLSGKSHASDDQAEASDQVAAVPPDDAPHPAPIPVLEKAS
jgi:hypothetical protein